MTKDEIWQGFVKLFPTYVERVESYEKIGSKSLSLKIKMPEGQPNKTLLFLYNDPWDWTFGSKIWRKKPRKPRTNIDQVIQEATKLDMNPPEEAKEEQA